MSEQTTILYPRITFLPSLVRVFCFDHQAWIVGSAALYMLGEKNEKPRDWDILVPFYTWGNAAKVIPPHSRTNTWGGVKIRTAEKVEIDVWAGDIGFFLGQIPDKTVPCAAVQPSTFTVLKPTWGVRKSTPKKKAKPDVEDLFKETEEAVLENGRYQG